MQQQGLIDIEFALDTLAHNERERKLLTESLRHGGEYAARSRDESETYCYAPTIDELRKRMLEVGVPADDVAICKVPGIEDEFVSSIDVK